MSLPYVLTPRQCSRCKSFDHLAKDCTFLAQDQMEENSLQKSTGYGARTSVDNQNLPWKYTRWYSPQARKDAVFTSEKPVTRVPTVSEPTSANLVGGTILRPIAHSLPRVQSPFPIDVWRDALRNHPDSDLGSGRTGLTKFVWPFQKSRQNLSLPNF